MSNHAIRDVELSGVHVSIHQERECNGFERSSVRTGYITLVCLNYGDPSFWDYEDNEEIQPGEVTCGLVKIIDDFWSKIEIDNDQ